MKKLIQPFFLLLVISCGQTSPASDSNPSESIEPYNTFDKQNHLQPYIDKASFDTLHEWDLGWALLDPINKLPIKGKKKLHFQKDFHQDKKRFTFTGI